MELGLRRRKRRRRTPHGREVRLVAGSPGNRKTRQREWAAAPPRERGSIARAACSRVEPCSPEQGVRGCPVTGRTYRCRSLAAVLWSSEALSLVYDRGRGRGPSPQHDRSRRPKGKPRCDVCGERTSFQSGPSKGGFIGLRRRACEEAPWTGSRRQSRDTGKGLGGSSRLGNEARSARAGLPEDERHLGPRKLKLFTGRRRNRSRRPSTTGACASAARRMEGATEVPEARPAGGVKTPKGSGEENAPAPSDTVRRSDSDVVKRQDPLGRSGRKLRDAQRERTRRECSSSKSREAEVGRTHRDCSRTRSGARASSRTAGQRKEAGGGQPSRKETVRTLTRRAVAIRQNGARSVCSVLNTESRHVLRLRARVAPSLVSLKTRLKASWVETGVSALPRVR